MNAVKKVAKTLELDKILELLSNEATVLDAKERALSLLPDNNFEGVKTELAKTEAAYIFMSRYSAPSFGAAAPFITRKRSMKPTSRAITISCPTETILRSLRSNTAL